MGCKVERMAAAMWNGAAPQSWSWLVTEMRRLLSGYDVQFWKCWETQSRGLLHVHAIIRAVGVSHKRMSQVWKQALATSYEVKGFTFEWGKQSKLDAIGCAESVSELIEVAGMDPEEALEHVKAGNQAAELTFIRYGAKYCTKGGARASTVNRVTGELRDNGRGYRTWSASSRWGLTMKQVRGQQREWIAQRQAEAEEGRASALIDPAVGSEATLDTNTDIYAGTNQSVIELSVSVVPQPL
jgi:hypothetical protein